MAKYAKGTEDIGAAQDEAPVQPTDAERRRAARVVDAGVVGGSSAPPPAPLESETAGLSLPQRVRKVRREGAGLRHRVSDHREMERHAHRVARLAERVGLTLDDRLDTSHPYRRRTRKGAAHEPGDSHIENFTQVGG